ncbi:penicillin-binding protein 1B [Endozoicomonas sp. SM1973]|uniref:Penicillin-binding protein 1B n=1 Tax=Spartinivicinus marinus TaxID=2994442 RepID=A0A853I5X6_9GAMM|nr:penicillin-binding protein 1B [Spartinivicinus marinus]MCX4026327.1 penicillin-binding protein 1B [Spartinivicinus marinus]NYZ69310.1 penicillin-binding protein 1B [Spartinivicinus marinus]
MTERIRTGRQPANKSKKSNGKAKKGGFWKKLFKLTAVLLVIGGVLFAGYASKLDIEVTDRFEGKKWAIPAKVYAQPLELFSTRRINAKQLTQQLDQLGYQPVSYVERAGQFHQKGNTVTVKTRGFQFDDGYEESALLKITFQNKQIKKVVDQTGQEALARLEPQLIGGIYPASNEDRLLTKLDQLPETFIPTLLAVEDRNYYDHWGVSPKSIIRAFYINFKTGRAVQGGSTLTQQLVKNLYLSNERSLKRKANEAIMAGLLDFHYDKDEILETYINEVFLGQQGNRAIHGFGLASQFFFGQPINELSVEKVALLVGMIKGPSQYNPRRKPKNALKRRNLVLKVMAQQGVITEQEANQAKQKPLGVVKHSKVQMNHYYAYLDLVKRQLKRDYDEDNLTSQGLRIFTNLDPIVQQQAQKSLTETLKKIRKSNEKHKALQGAMVVTAPGSGDVLAVIGDRKAGYTGFNRAVDAQRHIGSLIKPVVFLSALTQPEQYTLATFVDDSKVSIKTQDGQLWEPNNFDHKSHGAVPLHEALAKSYNLATANIGLTVGVEKILQLLKIMGADQEFPAYPSSLLGAVAMSPVDVATVYQTLAGGGFKVPLRTIRAVLDAEGKPLQRYPLAIQQVIPSEYVHLLQYAMQEVMREGTGRRAYRLLNNKVRVAGKTGTSNEQRDSWFAGYSEDYLAVVWMGHDDNKPTPVTGSSGALRVWTDFMFNVNPKSLRPKVPDQVRYVWVDEISGMLANESCAGARYLPFIKGSEPQEESSCIIRHQPQRRGSKVVDWFRTLFR